MAFFLSGFEGLNNHELMPLRSDFKEQIVEKTQASVTARAIKGKEHHKDTQKQGKQGKQSKQHLVANAYQTINQLPRSQAVIHAEQIMNSPVVTIGLKATVNEALTVLHEQQIRHLPVISADGLLVGILSDRDILRYLAGITEKYQVQAPHNRNERITQLMKSPVLTASTDTDVRYIARLFVEQHVGSLPIICDGELKGIISRSDVLNAVIRHYVLELWA